VRLQAKADILSQSDNVLNIADTLMRGCIPQPLIEAYIAVRGELAGVFERTVDDQNSVGGGVSADASKEIDDRFPGHDMTGIGGKKAVKLLLRPGAVHVQGQRRSQVSGGFVVHPGVNTR